MAYPRDFFGTYLLKPGNDTYAAVSSALRVGYRAFDTAPLYRNESDVGRAIRDSALSREEIFIQTKIWDTDQGYEGTHNSVRQSMQRLGVKHINSVLIHSPRPGKAIVQDSWRAMTELKAEGHIGEIGVSNFGAAQIGWLQSVPAINQIDISPFNQRRELRTYCQDNGILLQVHSSLTRGYKLKDDLLQKLASRYKHVTPAMILLAWCRRTCDSVVVKSRDPAHMVENLSGLTQEEMSELESLETGYRVMGWDVSV